jgi:hypothetical protein
MRRELIGNIDKVFHTVDSSIPEKLKYRYCNFIFEGNNVGDEFTEEELEELEYKNVKIIIETID